MEKALKTVLVYPQLEFAGAQIPTPPYSILFIADYLLKRNIDVKVFDLRFDSYQEIKEYLSDNRVEYVGISAMTGPQIKFALFISHFLKTHFSTIKIVWGGIHATILPEQTLQNPFIDLVIRGEGEKPYFQLVSGKDWLEIKGLSYKVGKKIFHNEDAEILTKSEINEQEIPWELINPQNYIQNGNFIIITSRGCPYRCSFCYNSIFNNMWRGWSAEKCIMELNKAIELSAQKITFYDDNFFANSKRVATLFQYFKEKKLIWKAELRVDQLNHSLAQKARDHGCEQLFFGAESGSQKVLDILNKEINVNDIIKSARITRNTGISADYSWMVGIPGETCTDVRKTLAVIKKIRKINPECEFSVKILFPYPKTVIYSHALNKGFNPPQTLSKWGDIRRERASDYLHHKNLLEMISITSAIVGKNIFTENNIPPLKILRFFADFRWQKELFSFGLENLFFKIFKDLIDKIITKKNSSYDPFTHKIT
ncbi:MAG: putative enzyme [Promethearchaeota archaeon]|nr:MAG: putative enzyme [Candidatus Lokiarchaeota archaeon]